MHFEILVEGQCELTALSMLMPKIVGEYEAPHTWKIHKHRGIGRLPDDPAEPPNKKDPTLLHNLPSKLRAYGNCRSPEQKVIVLVDLDDREDCAVFKQQLASMLDYCDRKPVTLFRIAIEELEAWFLGDREAILKAYPSAKMDALDHYVQDSQCGTWETLADIVHPGGAKALETDYGKRSSRVLEQKRDWTKNIAEHMEIQRNHSGSFCAFRDGLQNLIEANP